MTDINRPTAATPSVGARLLAFGSILLGGLCGGLIGYAFIGLDCEGSCSTWQGVGALVGALVGAVGIGIVATLALRAMGEWETIKARDEDQPVDPAGLSKTSGGELSSPNESTGTPRPSSNGDTPT